MKKTKLTRSLLAACSIVALTAVMYGCSSGPSQSELDAEMERAEQAEMQVTMLQGQINALRMQLGLDADDNLGDNIADLQQQVDDLEQQIADAAEAARMAQEEADRKAAEAAAAAMAATAAKLYAGIYAPAADATGTGSDDVFAAYNDAGTPTGAAVDTHIMVTIGTGGDSPTAGTPVALSEDKKTMVADNSGWAGKRYADPAGGDMYEAMVYSNVAAPTMGDKFGSNTAGADGYEYDLTNGALPLATINANPGRVTITGVTRTSGTETFKLPDPNPNNEQDITRGGSYHGVSGTYTCDTGAARTDACTATVAAEGFTLTGAWTFTPSNAETRVMDSMDTAYASYGWWLLKAANDGPFTASAFHDFKGTDVTVDLPEAGTATYVGGAAGKYALASSTGGTNDAGHFTARATLEATFGAANANEVTGTIDNFIGADGEMRDWSVKLNEGAATDAGVISGPADDQTVWTIGDNAADASGSWSGNFREQGDDGVPEAATGTFYSEYGTAGRMVGAFGANEQ